MPILAANKRSGSAPVSGQAPTATIATPNKNGTPSTNGWAPQPVVAPLVVASVGLTKPLDFKKVTTAALAFMAKSEKENNAAIAADGVGLRFGERSPYGKMTPTERKAFVTNIVKQKHPEKANDAAYINGLMTRMKSTSCIGYTMEGLAAGYKAAGQTARWTEIAAAVKAKGTIGTTLVAEMQKDGWEAVYWNADTGTYRGPTETANDKQRLNDHAYFNNKFIGKQGQFKPGVDEAGKPIAGRDYYGTYPQRALVNFFGGPAGTEAVANKTQLAHLKNAPYWVGVAAGGYHTFSGSNLNVRDSHVARDPDDKTNLENRPFQELDLAWDKATRNYKKAADGTAVYSEEQSGVLVIPPGTWTN
jgi:hypothetical protein